MARMLKLGKYVFLEIIKEWLTIKDVCFLDTSLLSRLHRQTFTDYLFGHGVIFHGLPSGLYISTEALEWMEIKRICVSSMELTNNTLKTARWSVQTSHAIQAFKVLRYQEIASDNNILRLRRILPTLLNLTSVELSDSEYIDNICLVILGDSCKQLKTCDFSKCSTITNKGVTSIAKRCPNLQHISLNNCGKITDTSIVEIIKKCRDLQTLKIDYLYRNITDETVNAFTEFGDSLTSLSVQNCRTINETAMTAFLTKNGSKMRHLDIASCRNILTDNVLTCISTYCLNVEFLNISTADSFSEETLCMLFSSCINITKLHINNMVNYTLQCTKTIISHMTKLHEIHFNQARHSVCLESCLLFMKALKNISVMDTKTYILIGEPVDLFDRETLTQSSYGNWHYMEAQIRTCLINRSEEERNSLTSAVIGKDSVATMDTLPQQFLSFIQAHPQITSLNITYFNKINDSLLISLSALCHNLQEFYIVGATNVTDEGVIPVVQANPHLTHLNANGCIKLTDATLHALSTRCLKLRTLKIVGSKITDEGMCHFVSCCGKRLREVNIGNCNGLTEVSVSALRNQCSNLLSLFYAPIKVQ